METVYARDLGKEIPTEQAYTPSKNPNKKSVYYSSREGFEFYQKWHGKCIDLLDELCVDKDMRFPPMAIKMLNEHPNQKIIHTAIELSRNNIEWVVTHKEFSNEYGKWKYIFAIILNNYNSAVEIENKINGVQKDIAVEDDDIEVPIKQVENRNIARFLV